VTTIFERFALDYVGPLPTSIHGKQHILVAMEYYTKWPIVKAVEKADQESTAKFLYEEIYAQFGPPAEFLTDNGTHFDNITMANFCAMARIKHKFSAPYHPQTNGLVERFNGTLVKALKRLASNFPRNWDDYIPAVLFAYRTRSHSTIGVSPYELMFGTTPRSHEQDLLLQLGRRLGDERLYYLSVREPELEALQATAPIEPTTSNKFDVGTKVLRVIHTKHGKLSPTYEETPLLVLAALNNGSYKLATQDGLILKRAINGMHLRQWHERPQHLL
jgi:hypothetical protein